MRKINKIIVHCSASDNYNHDNIRTIREWHLERGFSDIGYHVLISKPNGSKIQFGRPIEKVGAHCKGQNSYSIGICLTGLKRFTADQIDSLIMIIKHYMAIFDLSPDDVFGHYEFNDKKTCPNMDMNEIRSRLYE